MAGVLERIDGCIESNTPFPNLHGLAAYLKSWETAQVSAIENPRAVSAETLRRLSWWPAEALETKAPGAPGVNLWPCVPMRDWLCWAPGAQYQHESCDFCCDPKHGSQGCKQRTRSFARCCQTP